MDPSGAASVGGEGFIFTVKVTDAAVKVETCQGNKLLGLAANVSSMTKMIVASMRERSQPGVKREGDVHDCSKFAVFNILFRIFLTSLSEVDGYEKR